MAKASYWINDLPLYMPGLTSDACLSDATVMGLLDIDPVTVVEIVVEPLPAGKDPCKRDWMSIGEHLELEALRKIGPYANIKFNSRAAATLCKLKHGGAL